MSNRVLKHGEVISQDMRTVISGRYHTICKAINREFWNSLSDTDHSLYVGSYGRGTAIDASDVDMLVILPESEYNHYDYLKGNGQSRLLQAVKKAILASYPRSDVKADGQVVVINFSDGIKFEVLPAFKNWNNQFTYPDTNMGGNWRATNPKAEQEAMREKNVSSNGLLLDTCKHIRRLHEQNFKSYHLSGIVIDSFVYHAIGNWRWTPPGGSGSVAGTYEKVLLDYYNEKTFFGCYTLQLTSPGSNQMIDTEKSYECLGEILQLMNK